MSRPLFWLAGGGTGGHLFPNLAVVERLRERGVRCRVRLLVSSRPLDVELAEQAGLPYTALPVVPPSLRPGPATRFAGGLVRARSALRGLLTQERPTAVLATGGFVSPPVLWAARRAGVPSALINLDAVPGRAGLMLSKRADAVFSVHPAAALPEARTVGYPLRFAAVSHLDPASARAGLGLATGLPTLLVFAGSQGARTINRAFLELLRRARTATLLRGWQVLHLTGKSDTAELREAYAAASVPAVAAPFCKRMGLAWASADAAVARAGGGSVAEAHANTTPTLFLPYPFHRDLHQRLNALPLVNAGGALMMDDAVDPMANATALAGPLNELLHNRAQRDAMRTVLRERPLEDGAHTLADWLVAKATGGK